MYIADSKIDDLLQSDGVSLDLSTELLKDELDLNLNARLAIKTRQDLVFSGGAIAKKIALKFGCKIENLPDDGAKFHAGDEIFSALASFKELHKIYKIIQIIFEYSCKISTYTYEMMKLIKNANPRCTLGATRKSLPFAKELCVNAVIAGGATMHRLGLNDSVLFFENHTRAFLNFSKFCKKISAFKQKLPEKKIMVEVANFSEFCEALECGADVIICDKMSQNLLKECVLKRDKSALNAKICAAGGIDKANCENFAKTGVDYLITSAVYTQGVCDLSAKIEIL